MNDKKKIEDKLADSLNAFAGFLFTMALLGVVVAALFGLEACGL